MTSLGTFDLVDGDLAKITDIAAVTLTAVHRAGQVRRARLPSLTGRSRSAVAEAVAELERVGLIEQGAPIASRRVGRPSPTIRGTDAFLAAAVNPDTDGLHLSLYTIGGTVVRRWFEPSETMLSPQGTVETVSRLLDRAMQDRPDSRLVGMCAAIPGWVNKELQRVESAPHLGWGEVPLAEMLESATGVPTSLVYDAIAGLAAERLWGSARATENAVYFYGGPGGIGAAALVDGHLLSGARGHAVRLGHLIVATSGPKCTCGAVGCLTSLVSAPQIESALRNRVSSDRGDDPFEATYYYVARALRLAVHTFDPELVILGGFFATLLNEDRLRLENALRATGSVESDSFPVLVTPQLGGDHVLAGASHFAFTDLLADPTFVHSPADHTH
ncbi:ROK family protein [Occultella aeris]|uniref:N-acetylglucosamine repressor n=1 Tax=Occultella aeris TaxID=2761496 RepID=A0A7M4DGF0_9MICO|nr:ROK family protein [Occultella aeris]VZO35993.1 N-acetylglucosamine repressor [Occultella aeris]